LHMGYVIIALTLVSYFLHVIIFPVCILLVVSNVLSRYEMKI
jgi:hypothetical protein